MNYRLYFYEILFACLVIFAHINFQSNVGDYYLDSLGRSTVLFFFILSSFFYNRSLAKEDYCYKKTLKRCLRLSIILVITVTIYYSIYIPLNIHEYGKPALFSHFSWENLKEFFINYLPNMAFCWFIVALILCYLIYPLIHKIKWLHNNKYAIIIPLIILVVVYTYRIFASKYNFEFFSDLMVTRNFILTGLPCFLIGGYIYDHQEQIKKIKPIIFYTALIILFAIGVFESFIHQAVGTLPNEFYLSSIVLSSMVVIYCVQNSKFKFGECLFKLFGSTAPTFIYLFHLLLLSLYLGFFNFNGAKTISIFLTIISILIISLSFKLLHSCFIGKQNLSAQ